MDKIYVFAINTGKSSYGIIRDAEPTGDVMGYAVTKDFAEITSHFSSGVNWSKHDMGITSDWKHDIYKQTYPNGYELIWLGEFDRAKEAKEAVKQKEEICV